MADNNKDAQQRQSASTLKEGLADAGEMSRRKFLTIVGGVGVLAAAGIGIADVVGKAREENADVVFPVSGGYLIVDSMRCCGCQTCMMACAIAHHGGTNPGLSRIQIVGDSFQHFPLDMTIYQCHQCTEPKCVMVCPTGACHVDESHENVREITPEKCIGCMQCIDACPNAPSRLQWNHVEGHSQKCDLCHNTPYWDHPKGAQGTRACESSCPMVAIKFVTELPQSTGNSQYDVNMRVGTSWPSNLTYTTPQTAKSGGSTSKD